MTAFAISTSNKIGPTGLVVRPIKIDGIVQLVGERAYDCRWAVVNRLVYEVLAIPNGIHRAFGRYPCEKERLPVVLIQYLARRS